MDSQEMSIHRPHGGPSSGFQNFGLKGLLASGFNPTAQFVGSYGW